MRVYFYNYENLPYMVNLYYNCKVTGRTKLLRKKKYEILENMKNPSYIGQNKYENLEEPSRTSYTRYSYFFNTFVKSCQIFILIQSPSMNWPDLHTFSVSLSKFARLSYFFNLLQIWQTSIGNLSKIEEIS